MAAEHLDLLLVASMHMSTKHDTPGLLSHVASSLLLDKFFAGSGAEQHLPGLFADTLIFIKRCL